MSSRIGSSARLARRLPALAGLLLALACRNPEAPTVPVLWLEGRLERGDSARVVVTQGTEAVTASSIQFQISPTTGAHLLASGWLHFDAAGPLVLVATLPDGSKAPLQISVAVPPFVVFDYLAGGNRDIYVVALDGGDLRQLTTSIGDDQHPTAFSGTVVFTSYRDGNAELYRMPLSGGAETRLTTTSQNETQPSLSPDGRRLAFLSDASGVTRVWTSAADGTGAAKVATGVPAFAVEAAPVWGPASDRFAFTSTVSGSADIYQYLLTGALTVVGGANSPAADVEPAWTADASALVFVSNRNGADGLYRLRIAEGSASVLLPGAVGQPTVLADGRVVFTAFESSGSHLRWIDPAAPTVVHDIPTGTGSAAHPSAVP